MFCRVQVDCVPRSDIGDCKLSFPRLRTLGRNLTVEFVIDCLQCCIAMLGPIVIIPASWAIRPRGFSSDFQTNSQHFAQYHRPLVAGYNVLTFEQFSQQYFLLVSFLTGSLSPILKQHPILLGTSKRSRTLLAYSSRRFRSCIDNNQNRNLVPYRNG